MKEITILSGKGGTGKTSITAAFGALAKNAIFCDNDVDAADLHLIFNPEIKETNPFFSGWKASITNKLCSQCNLCVSLCRFNAISINKKKQAYIDPLKCEGCLLCVRACPSEAIKSVENYNNKWHISASRFGTLVHAFMGPGEENSGKLVTQIRKIAKEIGKKNSADYIINDGPPGIGCTAISSLTGTHTVVLVIEPSKSGLHDVKRLVKLVQSFHIKSVYAIINKHDINADITQEVEHYLQHQNISLLAKIPFDIQMIDAVNAGKTIVEYNNNSSITKLLKEAWAHLQ